MSIKDGVALVRALSFVPYNTEKDLKMAMLIADRDGLDAALAHVEWLKEPMSCGHPRAAVRSSNPNATWDTTCWCAGCAGEAAE